MDNVLPQSKHCASHKPHSFLHRQNIIDTTSYANLHINSDPIYISQQSFLWVAGLLIAGLRLLPSRSSKTSGAWPLSRFLGRGDRHFQPYACKARSTLHGARPAANPAGSYPGRGAGLSLQGLLVDGALGRGWEFRRWPGPRLLFTPEQNGGFL